MIFESIAESYVARRPLKYGISSVLLRLVLGAGMHGLDFRALEA